MLIRKLSAALFSSLVLGVIFLFASLWEGEVLWWALIILFYALAGNFLYGLPVSLASEFLTKKFSGSRIYIAGFLHILFGYITVLVIEELAYFAVICALLFFFIDEGIRFVKETPENTSKKMLMLKLFTAIPFAALALWGISYQSTVSLNETNNVYLIPEGYEGAMVVYYNITDAPETEKEGELSILPLTIEKLPTLKNTDMEEYALFRTSSKIVTTGRITDKYYYVDGEGQRKEIDPFCTSSGPNRSSGVAGERAYYVMQVTNSECGEDFHISGNDRYTTQAMEILKYWEYR
ncbi:hypothetical protein M3936_14435 [Sutcliffiella horikoshii]|uniref:DUF6843 domain-containing protein n=1 Tax=Sutcliffiella horikoshii TaxID=79883 RepID=UPI00203CC8F1|nr:hypothetical protein [Sutcliffiella horikoshii]MCM3618784.1 hypothetical protein [Sutcliffiella horikoshii]